MRTLKRLILRLLGRHDCTLDDKGNCTDQEHDWCNTCNRCTRWNGVFCSVCNAEWGVEP